MSASLLILGAALLLFLLDAFGVSSRVGLQSAGLACVTLALILGQV